MNPQVEGIEKLPGTYAFDVGTGVRRYRINRYLWQLTQPAHREAFRADPEASFERAGLTGEERQLIRERDWLGLVQYGAIFFVCEKLARVDRIPNADMYAAMRKETMDTFLATRNVPGAR